MRSDANRRGPVAGVLFENGILTTDVLDERTADVLLAATDRGTALVQSSDILSAAISVGDRQILTAITMALADGTQLSHVQEIIEIHNPAGTAGTEFDGKRNRFSAGALRAFDEFEAAFSADQ